MLRKLIKLPGYSNYSLLKHSTPIKFFTSEQSAQETDAEIKSNQRVNEVFAKYNKQDEEKILNILNNYTSKELLGYNISKNRANKLLTYRMRNGLLKDLHDIFFVDSFGLKVVDKFYQSLLQEPKPLDSGLAMNPQVKTAPFITPSMEAEQRTIINACVAVRIGVNSITWSKLELPPEECNGPCELTHWQHHDISEKKLHINDLIQRCLYICHQIPMADCYLFENPQIAQASTNTGNAEQQNINIQRAQVTAMMGYALAARPPSYANLRNDDKQDDKKPERFPTVFFVRRLLTARLFQHLVGTERVSSEQTVLDLMRTYYNPEDMEDFDAVADDNTAQLAPSEAPQESALNIRGNVQFPMELREMFSQAPGYHREFLSQVLLLNLTFVRLALLQDPKSIAQVSRSARQFQTQGIK